MPSNVAMQRPNPRVIEVELQYEISWDEDGVIGCARGRFDRVRKQLNIATLRVLWIRDCSIPFAVTEREDPHVMTMEVHGVRRRESVVLQMHSYGSGFVAKIIEIILRWKGRIASVCSQQRRIIVINSECGVVHVEEEMGTIALEVDPELLNDIRFGRLEWVEGLCVAQRVVQTVLDLCGGHGGCGRWDRCVVRILVIDHSKSLG